MYSLEELVCWTHLHQAAQAGDLKSLLQLLEQRADAEARALDGTTPLLATGKASIVRALLKAGANPDAASDDGWDPATAAAARGDARSLDLLYAAGAAPKAEHAARFFHRRLKARLLEAGDHDSRREEWLGRESTMPDIFLSDPGWWPGFLNWEPIPTPSTRRG